MPEPRDPAPGNEDLSAFGGNGSTVDHNRYDPNLGAVNTHNEQSQAERARSQDSTQRSSRGSGGGGADSGRAANPKRRASSSKPPSGPRENWLNKVTLGTYKFTLYTVDDEVWNNPQSFLGVSDEPALSAGKGCIVAESGVEGAFVIENVVILTSAANPGSGNIDVTQITFEILEPLGFSLLDKLLAVGQDLGRPANFAGLNYVLKLEFLGRDPISGASKRYEEPVLYRGRIGGITGTLGEAGAKYFIEYNPLELVGQQESHIQTQVTAKDVTDVKTFVSELQKALNEHEEKLMTEKQDKPVRVWKIELGRSSIDARDYLALPSFDLASAPWAGAADSSTTAGHAEMLEKLGPRQVALEGESGLATHIQQKIEGNTPTFAEWLVKAKEKGIVESIKVIPSVKDLGENDPVLNVPRQEITLTINLVSDATIPPEEPANLQQLRNTKSVQAQRFDNELFPWIVKKYSYLYTGENTEVLDIDIDLQNNFYTAQSPAAGIYYANNRQQFEPNLKQEESDNKSSSKFSSAAKKTSRASARYLSEIKREKYNILQSPVFGYSQLGPQTQKRNETTATDTLAATAIAEYGRRTMGEINFTLSVRGDPIFMGGKTGTGNNIFDTSTSALYLAFVNFQADSDDLLLNQMRGPVDMITTGVYRILTVESKFQQGSFTQTITTVKDTNTTVFHVLDKLIEMEPK